jgi:ABC-type transport system involved in multi-copper enzyme maturation permease subunit
VRWKLLIIASLAAVVAGAGGSAGLLYLLTGRTGPTERAGWLVLVALVLPLAAITYASIFVYRRTARRRKLQAAATALASLALTLALYLAFAVLHTCCEPPLEQTPPAPTPINVS